MPIPVICPTCGRPARAPDHSAGKSVRCKCGAKFRVPDPLFARIQAAAAADGPMDADDTTFLDDDSGQVPGVSVGLIGSPTAVRAPVVGASGRPDSPPPWFSDLMEQWASQSSRKASRMPGPPEPWYYGFLDFYAKFCAFMGVLQFGIVLGIWGMSVGASAAKDASFGPMTALFGLPMLIGSFLLMLGVLLVSAPMLLAVDAARNIRAMRHKIE